jgi:hypothetical protein
MGRVERARGVRGDGEAASGERVVAIADPVGLVARRIERREHLAAEAFVVLDEQDKPRIAPPWSNGVQRLQQQLAGDYSNPVSWLTHGIDVIQGRIEYARATFDDADEARKALAMSFLLSIPTLADEWSSNGSLRYGRYGHAAVRLRAVDAYLDIVTQQEPVAARDLRLELETSGDVSSGGWVNLRFGRWRVGGDRRSRGLVALIAARPAARGSKEGDERAATHRR